MLLSRSLLALAVMTLAATAHAEGGCEQERGARSVTGTRATKIVFDNQSSERIRVYWIDYQGRRKFYSEVDPSQSYTQDTYMTHPWVVTDAQERCVLMFRPAPGATLATIHD